MACASLGEGGKNGVAAMVVLKSGISKWLWSAFCSSSPSKRGVIEYRVYVGKLGKSVPRQQEASGNHLSTHSMALGHVFLGKEICHWCCKWAPLFRFEEQGEMGWLRQICFLQMSGKITIAQEQNQSLLRNPMRVWLPLHSSPLIISEISQRQRAEKSINFSVEESPFRGVSSSYILG